MKEIPKNYIIRFHEEQIKLNYAGETKNGVHKYETSYTRFDEGEKVKFTLTIERSFPGDNLNGEKEISLQKCLKEYDSKTELYILEYMLNKMEEEENYELAHVILKRIEKLKITKNKAGHNLKYPNS